MPNRPYDKEQIAPRIRAIMKWRSWTTGELAEVMGYRSNQANAVMRAAQAPNRHSIFRLRVHTGVPIDWIEYGIIESLNTMDAGDRDSLLRLEQQEIKKLSEGLPPQRAPRTSGS